MSRHLLIYWNIYINDVIINKHTVIKEQLLYNICVRFLAEFKTFD